MVDHKQIPIPRIGLPANAGLPMNHCNLPAYILGGLSFQKHPVMLEIDGVEVLHRALFEGLDQLSDIAQRARYFMDYMIVHFRLESLQDAGMVDAASEPRANANYLRLLRGWSFDSNGRDGAVLKAWVESRFGLVNRYHKGPIHNEGDEAWLIYAEERSQGLYGSNALEAQLDVLYAYCQYELAKQRPNHKHLRLFRGVNRAMDYEVLQDLSKRHKTVLMNNLNSFTTERERAEEFGDYIMEAVVPLSKMLAYSDLLPNSLKGESEYLVIGGVYEVDLSYF